MSERPRILAVTGATGFVGSHLLDRALATGWRVRALTRRPQADRAGIEWISGALDRTDSLTELCRGSDSVIHIAGVVNAPDRAGFEAGNVTGTRNMADAAMAAGVGHFIHVSSLAATQPQLSDYGATKAGAEETVMESGLAWTIVRPPAIYGPRDTEMLELFRMARRGLMLLPPDTSARLSVIHVEDLAQLLLALAQAGPEHAGRIFEADDGTPDGWSHAQFAHAVGQAMDKSVRPLGAPRTVLNLAAAIDRAIRGSKAKLTPDRVRYFCHPDWTIDPARRPPADLWQPHIATSHGLQATVAWYREQGWL